MSSSPITPTSPISEPDSMSWELSDAETLAQHSDSFLTEVSEVSEVEASSDSDSEEPQSDSESEPEYDPWAEADQTSPLTTLTATEHTQASARLTYLNLADWPMICLRQIAHERARCLTYNGPARVLAPAPVPVPAPVSSSPLLSPGPTDPCNMTQMTMGEDDPRFLDICDQPFNQNLDEDEAEEAVEGEMAGGAGK